MGNNCLKSNKLNFIDNNDYDNLSKEHIELQDKYLKLKKKYNNLEKEYRELKSSLTDNFIVINRIEE
tara:strand:- start:343 stop:543 length:201 start_codon:yes stop_codon:yes gene_type:complete